MFYDSIKTAEEFRVSIKSKIFSKIYHWRTGMRSEDFTRLKFDNLIEHRGSFAGKLVFKSFYN